jgi:DMSO/TMAO reductase YedYZ molybdopterin-dependent catalytic subunit
VSRRQFLVTGSVGALALAANQAAAQAPAQTLHVKPVPGDVFIDHGINQETRLETLRGYLTPASHFFVRQHSNVPAIDLRTWRLRVEGDGVERAVDLVFDDLLRLPSRSVTAYVECAGNGRAFSTSSWARWPGTQWRDGAIGVAERTGVPMGAVRSSRRSGPTRRGHPERARGRARLVKVNRPMSLAKALRRHAPGLRLQRGAAADHGFPVRDRAGLGRHQQHQVGGRSRCARA